MRFALWREKVFEKSANSIRLNCPHQPERKKDDRHGGCHVEIGVAAAEERPVNVKVAINLVSPSDRTHAWNQAEPVLEQNENDDRRKKPKRFSNQIPANNIFQKTVKTFHEPFPKVLRPAGNWLDSARRDLGEDDNAERDDPCHQH